MNTVDFIEDDFEIIEINNVVNMSDIILPDIARSDQCVIGVNIDEPEHCSPNPPPSPNHPCTDNLPTGGSPDLTDDLNEKKFVCIGSNKTVKPTVKMSTGEQTEHKDESISIKDQEDDPVITKVITNVNAMQSGLDAKGNKVLGSITVDKHGTIVSRKRVKVTHQMIEAAYKKLRLIVIMKIDTGSITTIVAYALQIANEMLNTPKTYKVELALAITRKLIDDEVELHGHRIVLHAIVESVVPTLIDTIQGLPTWFSKILALCKCCRRSK